MNAPRLWSWRWLSVLLLLVATGAFLHSRSFPEEPPARKLLEHFPREMDRWTGSDVTLEDWVLDVLGADDVMVRIYQGEPDEPFIDFYVAFFESQRSGATIHSPQNCLPGAGWAPVEVGHRQLNDPQGRAVTVNRYVIAKGLERKFVLYWYQSHGRVVANEYWARLFLVADAIRLNRTDGALVRIITPVERNGGITAAEARAVEFAEGVLAELDDYLPR